MDRLDILEELSKETEKVRTWNVDDPIGLQKLADAVIKEIDKEEWDKLLNPKVSMESKSPTEGRGHLHFLIGLPRSGKSTWSKMWVQMRQGVGTNPRAIVCADVLRLVIGGQRFNGRIEPVVHMVKDYMIEALLASGHDVLVDGTHTQPFSIKRNFLMDPDASWTLINTPAGVCKERATATGQADLHGPIDRMAKQLKRLTDEGLSSVCQRLQEEARAEISNRERTVTV